MKKTIFIAVICLLFCACGDISNIDTSAATATATIASDATESLFHFDFIDSCGNAVTLNDKPESVAVLFSSFAEIWKLSGGEISVTVGDSVTRGFASNDAILVNDGAGLKVDIEQLIAAKPDFVIATADFSAQIEAADILRKNGIPVALFREEDFDDYLSMLRLFCDINKNETAYDMYGDAVKEQVDEIIKAKKLSAVEEVTYLFIRAGSTAKSTKSKTADNHFACRIIDDLGGTNIVDVDSSLTEELSIEYILSMQPDVILFAIQGDEEAARSYVSELLASAGWKELDAVKNGKYYFIPKDLFNYKPNCRWPEAYNYMAEIMNSVGKQ